ncbi:DNA N-6-adenine-methyltransferase [Singulisphaera sp. PoT]|uniref:DNA N-6-adenine-methyltransferase n=1 Tax=Singulisphaera sp. PoT TaxID=3411797 RepID=UPI003BF5EA11
MYSGLGSDLRRHRKARRLTQAALALEAGLTIPTVRLLERTRGTLASFDAVLAALSLEVAGRNLPAAPTLGARIAALRRSRGLNQRQLAEQAEVTQPTITALERHGRGRLEILNRVLERIGAGAYLAAASDRKAFYTHAGNASIAQDWETPAHILEALYTVFRRFDLDPCSPRRTRPPVKARVHYTLEDDGLSLPWHGVVFVNPPYGRQLAAWIAKAHGEVESGNARTVVALIPARTDTAYWHRHVAGKADIYFLKGRLSFGKVEQSAPFPSALAVWGADAPTLAGLDQAFPEAWKAARRS